MPTAPAGTLYRGREGMWSWVAHRVTGVLIFFFLYVHVLDTALVRVSPEAYNTASSTPPARTPARPRAGCARPGNVEEDHWEWHTFDTVKGGDYLVDQDAAEVMCNDAIDAVIDLEHMGLPFNRTPEGKIDQRRFGGHTRNHGEAPSERPATPPTAPVT
jgi:hypothetical protein